MAIDFPATSGQATDGSYTHTASGITWGWDGTTWKAQGVTGSFVLPVASSTQLGGIKVGSGLSITSEILSRDAIALNGLSDVTTGTISDGDVLKYSGTNSRWEAATDATSAYTNAEVDSHLNKNTANTGEVLSWNGSDYDWVAQSGGSGSFTIQDEGSALSTAATTLNFVGAGVTASGTGAVKTITIAGGGGGAGTPTITWTLTAPNAPSDYTFSGDGFPTSQTDPTLYLIRGQTYKFVNNTGGHPFRIQSTTATVGGGTQYNSGVTNQDAGNGVTLTFVVPMDAPDTLYYQCTAHTGMFGTINILNQGSGGGGTGLQSRQTFNAATNSIANGAVGNITITAYKTYSLLKIQTSAAAWVTLYTDQASRTADASRSETTDPIPGSGVIAEVITTAAQTQIITPATIGWNNESTPVASVYAKVVNKSGGAAAITVTITVVQLEG